MSDLNPLVLAGGLALLVAIAATAIAAGLAVACGALEAWSRLSGRGLHGPAVYAPPLLVAIAVAALADNAELALAALVAWLNLAWVVHREVAILHGRAFIDAARLAGLTPGRIVGRHVLPHLGRPVGARALLTVPQVLCADALRQLLEAALR